MEGDKKINIHKTPGGNPEGNVGLSFGGLGLKEDNI